MRHLFSIVSGIGLLFLSLQGYALEATGKPATELVILHTNDLHTHFAGTDKTGNACNTEGICQGGYGEIAQLINKYKQSNPNVLVLDAGDRLQGSLAYSINKWKGAEEFEKYLAFDTATIGNHEYDEGCDELAKYIRSSHYKVVAANMKIGDKGALKPIDVAPYEIKEYNGIKVGIIGLASDILSSTSPTCNNVSFTSPRKAAQEAIDELKKQGVGLIIVLSHLGIERDIELGQTLKGADIIVGGHSHKYIGKGSSIGPYPMVLKSPDGKPVLMVTTNGLARFLGEIRLELNSKGELISWDGEPIHLDKAGGQKEISSLVEKNYKEVEQMLETSLFVNKVDAKDGFDACRHGSCLTASLMAEAMADYGKDKGVEIALINGGTVRNGIPLGSVTRGDLLAAMPFSDIIVIKRMKGSEIIEALKEGLTDLDGIGPRMLHAYGLRYWHNPDAPLGSRLIKATVVEPDGTEHPINLDKEYIVATTKFLSEGGDQHLAIKNSKTVSEPDIKILDIIENKFSKEKVYNKDHKDDINIVSSSFNT